MTTWIVVVLVGIGSFGFRLAPLLLAERLPASPALDRTVRNAGTAALTALVVTSVDHPAPGMLVPTLAAAGVGLALAVRGATTLRVIGLGLATSTVVHVGLGLVS